jgi:hypothetical protein
MSHVRQLWLKTSGGWLPDHAIPLLGDDRKGQHIQLKVPHHHSTLSYYFKNGSA